jgi:hypothetical protein
MKYQKITIALFRVDDEDASERPVCHGRNGCNCGESFYFSFPLRLKALLKDEMTAITQRYQQAVSQV